MSSSYSASLLGPAPWGFRLQGGKEFNIPLTVSRLTDGGKAAKAGVAVGDLVLSIDGISTEGMNHLEAQNKIKACTGNLNLTLQKASSVPKDTAIITETVVMNGPQSILKKTQSRSMPRRHVVETDIEFYHVPTHGGASKQRLIQDTEDWRPRTGTSQSRSFRILAQITGTEPQQGQENEAGKKPNVVLEGAQSSASTKEPTAPQRVKMSPVKPPPIQTGNPAGPGVSEAGVQMGCMTLKGPESVGPTPQLHPKYQDSLVQRAEHIPAGARTPMCSHCDTIIRGPFLVANGKPWHPEEFVCAHCHAPLADMGFVEEQGRVYCEHCYEEFFAPVCGRCEKKILGEVINALKQSWHISCFLCASCQQPVGSSFHLEDGEPYCQTDYYSLFGTSCQGCEFPIEAGDKFLEAMGFTWHDTCFVCAVCGASLEGQAFFSKKDKPLCRKHAHAVKI